MIALDRVLANIDTSQIIPKNVEGVKADPPPIFFSKTPAVLVNIDGDPIWSPIKDNDLHFAVNTNWDLFQHGPTKTFYLRNDTIVAEGRRREGPWTPAGTLPDSFTKLPDDDNWKDVKASAAGHRRSAPAEAPTVFVSLDAGGADSAERRAELSAGPGHGRAAVGQQHRQRRLPDGHTGTVYFLVPGRWFSAPDFGGPWTFATPKLPEDFKKIPLEHPRSRVLASVPGTTRPPKRSCSRRFRRPPRSARRVQGARGRVSGRRRSSSRSRQTTVAARGQHRQGHPEGRRPLLHVLPGRLVHVEDADRPVGGHRRRPESNLRDPGQLAVLCRHLRHRRGATTTTRWCLRRRPAYTGVMVAWGCAVWGTGYYYPPYYGYGGIYPVYYPHYPTYGYGARITRGPAPTRAARSRMVPMAARASARATTRDRHLLAGAAAYGPYGARGAAQAYNPRTGTYAADAQGANVYGSWGATGVQRGDQWASTPRTTNNATGVTTRATQGSAAARRSTRRAGRQRRRPSAERQRRRLRRPRRQRLPQAGRQLSEVQTTAAGTTSSSRRPSSASRRKRMRRTGSLHGIPRPPGR